MCLNTTRRTAYQIEYKMSMQTTNSLAPTSWSSLTPRPRRGRATASPRVCASTTSPPTTGTACLRAPSPHPAGFLPRSAKYDVAAQMRTQRTVSRGRPPRCKRYRAAPLRRSRSRLVPLSLSLSLRSRVEKVFFFRLLPLRNESRPHEDSGDYFNAGPSSGHKRGVRGSR